MSAIRLLELKASNYGSLRRETTTFGDLNVFIGPNASGKSTILDALRFLQDALRQRDFTRAVGDRGGPRYLFGKWDEAKVADLSLLFEDVDEQVRFQWAIRLTVKQRRFSVDERVTMDKLDGTQVELLSVEGGSGWWMSGNGQSVQIEQGSTTCALALASADADFGARSLEQFIADWRFIEPNLFRYPPKMAKRRVRPLECRRAQFTGTITPLERDVSGNFRPNLFSNPICVGDARKIEPCFTQP